MWIEIGTTVHEIVIPVVTSLAEVWIEIGQAIEVQNSNLVTSLAEVWIEISYRSGSALRLVRSLPLRKCGLKCQIKNASKQDR